MKIITTAILGAVLAATIPAAVAQAPNARGHGKNEFVETYDANKDGKVSRAEYAGKRGENHKGLDLNRNGQVNEIEYINEYIFRLDKQLAEQRANQIRQAHVRFGVLDLNKDGVLSVEEFNESGDRMFSRLDTNSDGVIDGKDTAAGY